MDSLSSIICMRIRVSSPQVGGVRPWFCGLLPATSQLASWMNPCTQQQQHHSVISLTWWNQLEVTSSCWGHYIMTLWFQGRSLWFESNFTTEFAPKLEHYHPLSPTWWCYLCLISSYWGCGWHHPIPHSMRAHSHPLADAMIPLGNSNGSMRMLSLHRDLWRHVFP